jgi:ABC-2 type transport system ATP-binding protein
MDEAERCSRVGLIYQGQMVVCDTPEAVKAMTEGELIALWPTDVRRGQVVLEELDGVLEVQIYGDQLRVFCQDGDEMMEQMRAVLAAEGIEVKDMKRARPRMEEAFISLIRKRMSESAPEGEPEEDKS